MPCSGFAGGFRIAVFTAEAGVGDVAFLGAGRKCFFFHIVMSESRKNDLLGRQFPALFIHIAAAHFA